MNKAIQSLAEANSPREWLASTAMYHLLHFELHELPVAVRKRFLPSSGMGTYLLAVADCPLQSAIDRMDQDKIEELKKRTMDICSAMAAAVSTCDDDMPATIVRTIEARR
jgi:hypothetical protein